MNEALDDATTSPLLTQTAADYASDESLECETTDHEDHTFSGIIFVVSCPRNEAVEAIFVTHIAVRGELGPVTIWVAPGAKWAEIRERPECWTRVYRGDVRASCRKPRELRLQSPVRLLPGEDVSVYVHSALRSDTGIVYDNQRSSRPVIAKHLRLSPGCAHLSPRPFSGYHPWGAWRNRRQFVGRVKYSARHLLWSPRVHRNFPAPFRRAVRVLLAARRREESPLSWLPEDVLFYIIHLCQADSLQPGDDDAAHKKHHQEFFTKGGSGPLTALFASGWWRAFVHHTTGGGGQHHPTPEASAGSPTSSSDEAAPASSTRSSASSSARSHLAESDVALLTWRCPIVALLAGPVRLLLGPGPQRTAPETTTTPAAAPRR